MLMLSSRSDDRLLIHRAGVKVQGSGVEIRSAERHGALVGPARSRQATNPKEMLVIEEMLTWPDGAVQEEI
jgi:hypothetical protein